MSFMMLKSQCHSSLWQQDLLYCQFYNISKKIFIMKNHELFVNMNLNELTLNSGLLHTWQHIERKLSQSSLILLKAYIHMKQQCHFALADCHNQFYETWEKYHISESVLREMNWIFHELNMTNKHLLILLNLTLFFSHCTADILNWVQWNVNKLCLNFELIFSLQLWTMIHWEHSCVMMMFLWCLLCDYENQSNHIWWSNRLWLNNWVNSFTKNSEMTFMWEELNMKTTLQHYEYMWFLDKLNWSVITFWLSHQVNMMFNTLNLQIIYHSWYHQIVESKSDFIKFHDIFALMKTHCFDAIRLMLLLCLLIDLVLHVFHKDVFIALTDDKIKQSLDFKQIVIAWKRDISLTETEISWVFLHSDFSDDLQFLTQTCQRVISVEILFAWLWDWNENDSDSD